LLPLMVEPTMADILENIVADRRRDLAKLGPSFGSRIPTRRLRPLVPFLAEPGAILEIKRASPSRGDIVPTLEPIKVVAAYATAGVRNISVLTERNYFKGSLEDLIDVSTARPELAYLRKDFLLQEEEIELSYRAGADAVLLIARILDVDLLRRMADLCRSFGMTPFVEVREYEDYAKLRAVAAEGMVLCGVNARDLATFSIDPLIPAAARSRIPGRAVYESGIDSAGAAAYARRLGFDGILVGEAAIKDPAGIPAILNGFQSAREDAAGIFWRRIAERRETRMKNLKRPLVKICGLARTEDALLAANLGADLLGFVFAESPRAASVHVVREVWQSLHKLQQDSSNKDDSIPFLVGVITEIHSSKAESALSLAREGILDAIQWHGESAPSALAALDAVLEGKAGRYAAARIGNVNDLAVVDLLRRSGEPRILADARAENAAGGTGMAIAAELAQYLADRGFLWLAGGLSVGTVGHVLKAYTPELIDVSSKLEVEKGKKDHGLMAAFFKEIDEYANE
jgi:indole-3-glycerol phosphate synthase/phosphoribosylanthranilate isomerase